MAAEKTETRGLWPTPLAQAVDAIAYTYGLDRNALTVKVMTDFANKVAHRSKVLQSMAHGNPLLSEPTGPTSEWGELS